MCSGHEADSSLFDRYLYLLSASGASEKVDELDRFYDLYSMVLGSMPAPLLFNIAAAAIDAGKHEQGDPLLKNITDRHPGFVKAEELKKKMKVND